MAEALYFHKSTFVHLEGVLATKF